jgi:hypothetical protein
VRPHTATLQVECQGLRQSLRKLKDSDVCAFANKMPGVTSELPSKIVIKVDRIYQILTKRFRLERPRIEKWFAHESP